MDYVLQTNEVTKDFSGKLAVDRVSIKVKKGDIYGFIGENGAGKTTLMRMVCGLAAPTSGDITLFKTDFPAQNMKNPLT
jgi:ABC-2 type transport system ATP-binding protein